MDRTGLRRLAAEMRLPLGTVEKDQAITLTLGILAGLPSSRHMVFKGGTALGKIYFDRYRFSEDLDFTLSADVTEELLASASAFVRAGEDAGIRLIGIRPESPGRLSRRVLLRYKDLNDHPNSIRVEMSLREKLLRPHELRPIRDAYHVLDGDVRIRTMALPEIMAENVRALFTRRKARDLYDLWRLVDHGVPFERSLAEAKLAWRKPVMHYDASLAATRVGELESVWQRDMPLLVADPPLFARAAATVLDALGA